jgi:hypothetical protein
VEIKIEGIGSLVNPVIAERRDERSRRRFMQLTPIYGASHELENA